MPELTLIEPGAGEVIGDAPDRRVEILGDLDRVHATLSRFAPGREGADLHIHRRHHDVFYVVEGELTVRLGLEDEAIALSAGTLAVVPPWVAHGFRNASDGQMRFLNLHAPGVGFADYLRAIRDGGDTSFFDQEPPPADGVRPASEAAIGGPIALEELAVTEAAAQLEEPHVHRRHVEAFYVLDGELVVTTGEGELRAPAGSWLQVPQDTVHAVASRDPVRYLNVHAPSCGFGTATFDQEPA